MSETITLAVDIMGGDVGPSVTVPACLKALYNFHNLKLILVGDKQQAEPYLSAVYSDKADNSHKKNISLSSRIEFIHTTEVISNNEKPSVILRNKSTSLYKVIELVAGHKAHACVSAGNTAAMLILGRYLLKQAPGIQRSAIAALMPTINGYCYVLDLGANIACQPEHLFQFAVMGSLLSQKVDGIKRPKVGLLNIGEEKSKGSDIIKSAGQLLESAEMFEYIGFVEGGDIFSGKADIIVCDGFVGNVMLKASEGLAKLLNFYLKQTFSKNFLSKLAYGLCYPLIRHFKQSINPEKYNGAHFLGLNGVVIKSHGNSTTDGFLQAIKKALKEVEANINPYINQETIKYLEKSQLDYQSKS